MIQSWHCRQQYNPICISLSLSCSLWTRICWWGASRLEWAKYSWLHGTINLACQGGPCGTTNVGRTALLQATIPFCFAVITVTKVTTPLYIRCQILIRPWGCPGAAPDANLARTSSGPCLWRRERNGRSWRWELAQGLPLLLQTAHRFFGEAARGSRKHVDWRSKLVAKAWRPWTWEHGLDAKAVLERQRWLIVNCVSTSSDFPVSAMAIHRWAWLFSSAPKEWNDWEWCK